MTPTRRNIGTTGERNEAGNKANCGGRNCENDDKRPASTARKTFRRPGDGRHKCALTYFTLDTRVQPAGIPPDVPAISATAARKPPQCRGAIYDARTPHARTTNGRGGMGGFPAYFFSATVPATERACGRRVSARRRSSRTSVRDRRGQHRRGPLGRPQRRHPNGRRWRCNGGRSG